MECSQDFGSSEPALFRESCSIPFFGCSNLAAVSLGFVLLILIGGTSAFPQQPVVAPSQHTEPMLVDLSRVGYLQEELVSMTVYERCNRSVVHISTKAVGSVRSLS